MATYSSNTTLKVSAAVAGSGSRNSTGNTTIYTNPSATAYAIVNVYGSGAGSGTITVGGQTLAAASGSYTFTGAIIGPSLKPVVGIFG